MAFTVSGIVSDTAKAMQLSHEKRGRDGSTARQGRGF